MSFLENDIAYDDGFKGSFTPTSNLDRWNSGDHRIAESGYHKGMWLVTNTKEKTGFAIASNKTMMEDMFPRD